MSDEEDEQLDSNLGFFVRKRVMAAVLVLERARLD